MPKKSFPLSKVYPLLEPGPVVMVTTAGKSPPKYHDHAMAHHAQISTPAGGLCNQQL
jgi:hypothetical protein